MAKKQIHYPIHKDGKICGYEEYEDGSIKIALSHSQKIDDAMFERTTIIELINSVIAQCQKLLVPIMKAQERFWDNVREDYDLDMKKWEYTYDRESKIISRKEKPKEEIKK